MKETSLTRAVQEVIEFKLKALDLFLEEMVDPLEQVGNPEKLIGKKYEEWTPQDLQMLGQIYGNAHDSPLARLIFRKEYEKVKQLEKEV